MHVVLGGDRGEGVAIVSSQRVELRELAFVTLELGEGEALFPHCSLVVELVDGFYCLPHVAAQLSYPHSLAPRQIQVCSFLVSSSLVLMRSEGRQLQSVRLCVPHPDMAVLSQQEGGGPWTGDPTQQRPRTDSAPGPRTAVSSAERTSDGEAEAEARETEGRAGARGRAEGQGGEGDEDTM